MSRNVKLVLAVVAMIGLMIVSGMYMPVVFEIMVGFQVFVSTCLLLIFSIGYMNTNESSTLNIINKLEKEAFELLSDPNQLKDKKKKNKLERSLEGLRFMSDNRERNKDFIVTVLVYFTYALICKYFGYMILAKIMLGFALTLPTFKRLMFVKMEKLCFNEVIDARQNINSKIQTLTNNSSE